ncbi:MAG: DUF1559 domain-containing protein [Planctomycetes bacterium]|nr:DUF1559 domain-containing protein [Planctomycetota bacterium]
MYARRTSRTGFGIIEILVIIAVIAFLIAVLLPLVQIVRQAAIRTQSMNNLKQIALAFHNFHDVHTKFPCNGSDNKWKNDQYKAAAEATNSRSGSWAFQILPYIEQEFLFKQINRNTSVPVYMCPGRARPGFETSNGGGAVTDYFMNHYLSTDPSKPDSFPKYNLGNIPDGSSNTVMVGHGTLDTRQYKSEKDVTLSTNIYNGGTTGTIRAGDGIGKGDDKRGVVMLARDSEKAPTLGSWGGPFSQGALIAFCDGSTRTFSYNMQGFRVFLIPDSGDPRPVVID